MLLQKNVNVLVVYHDQEDFDKLQEWAYKYGTYYFILEIGGFILTMDDDELDLFQKEFGNSFCTGLTQQ